MMKLRILLLMSVAMALVACDKKVVDHQALNPRISFSKAQELALDYLKDKNEFGDGKWILAKSSTDEKSALVCMDGNIYFWRLEFVFDPEGIWPSSPPTRTVSVLMSGRCVGPILKIQK